MNRVELLELLERRYRVLTLALFGMVVVEGIALFVNAENVFNSLFGAVLAVSVWGIFTRRDINREKKS